MGPKQHAARAVNLGQGCLAAALLAVQDCAINESWMATQTTPWCPAAAMLQEVEDGVVSSRVYWGGHQAEQAFTLLHGEAQLAGQEVAPGIYMQRRQTAVAEAACGDLTQASWILGGG